MVTAVELHKLPEVRPAFPPGAVLSAFALLLPYPRRKQPAPERLVIQHKAVLGKLLRGKRRAELLILLIVTLHDLEPELGGLGPVRWPAPREARGARGPSPLPRGTSCTSGKTACN